MGVDLDRIEALANAATPGPWGYKAGVLKHYAFSLDAGEDFGVSLQELHWQDGREVPAAANAQFIAAARTDVPALVAELRAARAEVERLRTAAADERADVVAFFSKRAAAWRAEEGPHAKAAAYIYDDAVNVVEQGAHVGAAKGGDHG